ncbi:hypothetical protein MF428_005143 [Salmonella enterica]|nr:hypothetical protein [Salmonella enterica]
MNGKITIRYDGATISIAPITLAFTEKLLVSLKGCELHSTFGIDSNAFTCTPGDELGCIRFNFNDSLPASFDTLNQFFSVLFPLGVTVGEHIGISKNLFELMILNCIAKPE